MSLFLGVLPTGYSVDLSQFGGTLWFPVTTVTILFLVVNLHGWVTLKIYSHVPIGYTFKDGFIGYRL